MLTVKTTNKLTDNTSVQATQVIVYNDDQKPIAFVIQLDDNKCLAACYGDDVFDDLVKMFNIE